MLYATYSMSKVFLTAATFAQQREFIKNDSLVPDVVVNSCCPGMKIK